MARDRGAEYSPGHMEDIHMRISFLAASALLFVGCGIPGSTLLSELSADDGVLICDHVTFDGTDQVEECGDPVGTVTIAASTYSDCTTYFTNVIDAANPDCVATFDQWKACKSEDAWDHDTVCAVWGGDMAAPVSADCAAVVTCATPVAPAAR